MPFEAAEINQVAITQATTQAITQATTTTGITILVVITIQEEIPITVGIILAATILLIYSIEIAIVAPTSS
jgi:hypothetical protein